jgi:hypothetical protein
LRFFLGYIDPFGGQCAHTPLTLFPLMYMYRNAKVDSI